ncbi:S1C family serine protease [Actinoplanes sp. L3-i22]|uniref:S1C family serine protease n=1 Tax=Actinoplanes sp. L3-i22 TaxID=2836373 RepID=UPI001C790880|nr:trypsin-like peptidase domain-containing protein [Actinoplanes sp. L3-i22]BCY14319.1 hypothetical protein L3i22_094070 [Actinoplanes sp. L3-i22]
MTATYEPFTPAGSPEPRRDRYASGSSASSAGEGYGSDRPASSERHAPAERYEDDYRRAADPWAARAQPQEQAPRSWESAPSWQQPEPAAPSWQQAEPAAPAWQRAEPAAPAWHQPEAAAPRWSDQPSSAYSAPAYTPPAYEVPQTAPRASGFSFGGRAKPIILGLVVLLLVVTGWQAYRIETMIKSSNDLASAVAGEQNRSAELEKALTNVFDPEGISSAALPSVFRVRAGDFTGTAFSVGTKAADGTANLFTNFHVVESIWKAGNKAVTLERGSTKINATIVKVNESKDLALLVAKKTIKPLAVFAGQVKPGQQVVVVGAPLGLDDTVTTGVISAYREDDADGPTIQFDAPINPGNSGGPVVNTSKQVVGLATAKARDAEGIGLAIPIATACSTFKVC